MAEWLGRNPLGSPRARSNPADYKELLSCFLALIRQISTCLEMILFNLNQLIPLNLQRKLEARDRALFYIPNHFQKFSFIRLKMKKEHVVKNLVHHSRTPVR